MGCWGYYHHQSDDAINLKSRFYVYVFEQEDYSAKFEQCMAYVASHEKEIMKYLSSFVFDLPLDGTMIGCIISIMLDTQKNYRQTRSKSVHNSSFFDSNLPRKSRWLSKELSTGCYNYLVKKLNNPSYCPSKYFPERIEAMKDEKILFQ